MCQLLLIDLQTFEHIMLFVVSEYYVCWNGNLSHDFQQCTNFYERIWITRVNLADLKK